MPSPKTTVPEKVDPPLGKPAAGETISDKLEKSGGVLKPDPNIGGGRTVEPPVPNPGTTPIIPAPGSPGGDTNIQPK